MKSITWILAVFTDGTPRVRALSTAQDGQGDARHAEVAKAETIPEIPAFLDRWKGIADFAGVGGFSSRLTNVALACNVDSNLVQIARPSTEPSAPNGGTFVLPFRDPNIWADGKAVLCCEDWNEGYVIGDLQTESQADIWNGARMRAVRELHRRGDGGTVEICAKCDNWMSPGIGARLWADSRAWKSMMTAFLDS